jgi:hypothetical protein
MERNEDAHEKKKTSILLFILNTLYFSPVDTCALKQRILLTFCGQYRILENSELQRIPNLFHKNQFKNQTVDTVPQPV